MSPQRLNLLFSGSEKIVHITLKSQMENIFEEMDESEITLMRRMQRLDEPENCENFFSSLQTKNKIQDDFFG